MPAMLCKILLRGRLHPGHDMIERKPAVLQICSRCLECTPVLKRLTAVFLPVNPIVHRRCHLGRKRTKQSLQVRPVRDTQLRRMRRCRSSGIGGEVRNGDVRLVSDSRDYRDIRCRNRTCHNFFVKCPKIFDVSRRRVR